MYDDHAAVPDSLAESLPHFAGKKSTAQLELDWLVGIALLKSD